MVFKILCHENALADLEDIFEWSREKYPKQRSDLPMTSHRIAPTPSFNLDGSGLLN